jgi:hypothetical protein
MIPITGHPENGHSGGIPAASKHFSIYLFAGVFASRVLTTKPVYFADAPLHVAAVQNHTYVIQAPGYWLLALAPPRFPAKTE